MDQILGHDAAIELLQRALAAGRVHHAWVFSGPRGVGKFTTALEFAKLLLDPAAQPDLAGNLSVDPEGETARLVDTGNHPDLHIVRKELALHSDNPLLRNRKLINIPVDVLREHVIGGKTGDDKVHDAPAYLTPVMGRAKVFIIDEAELIDRTGQNALLKTLEEPPGRTYLILVTSRPERLLATIRSRSQHVRFAPLSEAAMDEWFERRGLELEDVERSWIEAFAAGAPGMAELAAQYGFARWGMNLRPMLAQADQGHFPADLGATLAGFVDEFAEAWVKEHRNASKDAANKDGAAHVLSVLAAWARRRMRDAAESHVDGGEEADIERWAVFIDIVREAEAMLMSNVNAKLVFEHVAAQFTQAGRGLATTLPAG